MELKKYQLKTNNIPYCVKDLKKIIEYAKKNYEEINLWACSMGAYFSLLAYKKKILNNVYFYLQL